ncbi:hypothetical protein HAX54_032731, partial [Datura stramonium]|nr:hypothetical protein [Datura stramonium]
MIDNNVVQNIPSLSEKYVEKALPGDVLCYDISELLKSLAGNPSIRATDLRDRCSGGIPVAVRTWQR